MAGTTIKGVGNAGNVQMPDMAAAAKQNAGTGFQAVWNKTQNDARTQTNGDRTQTGQNNVRRGDSLNRSDRQREKLTGTSEDKDTTAEKTDVENTERAQEVLGTVVQSLVQQITEVFSVSEEELQGAMEDLGMNAADLLDPAKLNELLMTVNGAEDSFALLTDENLYHDVKGIMDLQKDLVGQAKEELQITNDQWQELVPQIAEETTGPVIVVETEEKTTDVLTTASTDTEELPATQAEPQTTTLPVQNTQEEKAKDSGNGHKETGEGQQGNLLLQNLKQDGFVSGPEQVAQTSGTQGTDTQDIMRQIMDYMKVSVKADSSDLEMQLHPQSLGTLHIQMASKNGVVTANFITENETVKAALESQMIQLKESFAEQGVKVEAIEVTVQTHQFEQNLEQGRGNQSDRESESGVGRRRTRRINLNAAFAEDEPQSEEDKLTADMMSANGNTVDFTA